MPRQGDGPDDTRGDSPEAMEETNELVVFLDDDLYRELFIAETCLAR